MKRCVNIYMIIDGINGRMPHAFETASYGSDLPDETFVEYEIRMYYHEAVMPPRYPVPAIRQHFEFGYQLGHGPVLMHCVQGVFDG